MSYAELLTFKKVFGFYDGPTGMPCNLTIITLPGATVEISLGDTKYISSADADGCARFTVGEAGLWNVIASTDEVTQLGTVQIENVVTKALALPAPLEDLTWSEISAISRAGLAAQNFSIGDTKQIRLSSGEMITAEIIGFNHDELDDGSINVYGRDKAGITFQTREVLTAPYVMHTGTSIWRDSNMRLKNLPAIKSEMPESLQNAIVPVKKFTSNSGSTSATGWSIITTIDELFLPSRAETINTSIVHPGEGTQYEYYASGHSLIKFDAGGTARVWYNRSAIIAGATTNGYGTITATGTASSANGTSSGGYMSFCFCV